MTHFAEITYKFEPENIWFTSDTHFYHENIIKFSSRPFANAAEMNEELIRRWNEAVPEDGIVFHLGDFCQGSSKEWNNILYRLNGKIYLILGNHEYYHNDIGMYQDAWELHLRDNVTMIENGSIVVDDTEFILSTLWSHIPMSKWLTIKNGLSDFTLIRHNGKPFTATTFNSLHKRDLDFIKAAVSASKAQYMVVVTHHVPSRLLVAPEFQNSSLESGFTVDLTDYIESSGIDLWVYGHSHRSIERVIGNTRMASNQIGYVVYGEQRKQFSGERFVDLDSPLRGYPQ